MAVSTRIFGLVAGSVAAFAGVAQADDLLIIDLTVPNQVTITATAGLSAITASGSDSTGVYLENFYGGAGSSLSAALVSGNLTNAENATDNSPALFRAGSSDPGLNIYSWSSASTVTFTAGSLAFTGSSAICPPQASWAPTACSRPPPPRPSWASAWASAPCVAAAEPRRQSNAR